MATPSDTIVWKRWHSVFFLLVVTALSYFTYMHNYTNPQAPYWDENYYITDAQREINHVFYMQIHPPLGKLLLAWGEQMIHPNARTDQFLDTEHADNIPKTFRFTGYRFFPVLLSWLAAPLLFLIFLLITESPLLSTFLSFFYIFDNALLVHNRGAMLDGPMIFFVIATALGFLLVLRAAKTNRKLILSSLFFGTMFALGFTTKFQNLVMILCVPIIYWALWGKWKKVFHFTWAAGLSGLFFFVAVWQIHFSHMQIIHPVLNNNGYYQASDTYKAILANRMQSSLFAFPTMLRDSLKYVGKYNKGIPKLDLCKPDENGSPFFLWPIGATTINYRWETPDGKIFHYLYLQSNPVIWFSGLAAVILSIVYLAAPMFGPVQQHPGRRMIILSFTVLYAGYMGAMMMMDRVLFLYSYFPPLVFSFVLFGALLMEARSIWNLKLTDEHRTLFMGLLSLLVVAAFQFFHPLTYYEALNDEQFQKRALLSIWGLHCVNCSRTTPLVRHWCQQ